MLETIALVGARAMFGDFGDDAVRLAKKLNAKQRDLDQEVEEAVNSLTKSSELISSLEEKLSLRADKLKALKTEYERVSQLATLTEEQGLAITTELHKAIGSNRTRERVIAFMISLLAGLLIFVVGVFAADWVKSIPELLTNK